MFTTVFLNPAVAGYIFGGAVLNGLLAGLGLILFQYFTFNRCPKGTRPLPSPKGRLPFVGHKHLMDPVSI